MTMAESTSARAYVDHSTPVQQLMNAALCNSKHAACSSNPLTDSSQLRQEEGMEAKDRSEQSTDLGVSDRRPGTWLHSSARPTPRACSLWREHEGLVPIAGEVGWRRAVDVPHLQPALLLQELPAAGGGRRFVAALQHAHMQPQPSHSCTGQPAMSARGPTLTIAAECSPRGG